jgi:hypothetical protein
MTRCNYGADRNRLALCRSAGGPPAYLRTVAMWVETPISSNPPLTLREQWERPRGVDILARSSRSPRSSGRDASTMRPPPQRINTRICSRLTAFARGREDRSVGRKEVRRPAAPTVGQMVCCPVVPMTDDPMQLRCGPQSFGTLPERGWLARLPLDRGRMG